VLVFLFGTGGGGAFYSAVQAPSVPLLPDGIWPRGYLIIPTLVAGTAVLMWMGELISQRGIGNGMSMIIFASVVAGMPGGFYSIWQVNKQFWFVALVLLTLAIIVAVVFVELGQRRIPVQFAKRVVGRRMMGGQNTYIPLKVNQSGVIPIIFASSILLLPAIMSSFLGNGSERRLVGSCPVRDPVVRRRLHPQQPEHRVHRAVRVADHRVRLLLQLDRVRPGAPGRPDPSPGWLHPRCPARPADRAYLAKAVNRITLPGAVFIAIIAILPYILLWAADVNNFPFAGTSVLISVGVALELMRQIDSQLMLRNYEGFLK
jgi:preprotein translocase subunit SecY